MVYMFNDQLVKQLTQRLVRIVDNIRYKRWIQMEDNHWGQTIFEYTPTISIIVPTHNTHEKYFRPMIESVINQSYKNWELIIIDDASDDVYLKELIKEYAQQDVRIRHKFLNKNRHISGATNEGIKLSTGEFISLFDHDDVLLPNALNEVVGALNKDQELDFIYTDEDKIDDRGIRSQPMLKPDWNPDLLRSVNYITHFTTIRKSLLMRVGYEREIYDGAQDWELFLRATRGTSPEKILHIPKVLYSWRIHSESTASALGNKPYVVEAQHRALLTDAAYRTDVRPLVDRDAEYSGQWVATYPARLPQNLSVVILDNSIRDETTLQITKSTKINNIEFIDTGYSFESLSKLRYDYTLVVSTPMKFSSDNWLSKMLADAVRVEIGMVTGRLQDDQVMNLLENLLSPQRAKLVRKLSKMQISKHLYLTTRYNVSVLEEGVALVKTSIIKEVVEQTPNQRLDMISLSGAISSAGYHNLYNPYIH